MLNCYKLDIVKVLLAPSQKNPVFQINQIGTPGFLGFVVRQQLGLGSSDSPDPRTSSVPILEDHGWCSFARAGFCLGLPFSAKLVHAAYCESSLAPLAIRIKFAP
jgi:hypothetical protein